MAGGRMFIALMTLCSIGGCSSSAQIRSAANHYALIGIPMSPGEANKVRKAIDGSEVAIRGYLRYRDDNFGVWTSREAFERNDISQCVTPLATDDLGSELRSRDGQIVSLVGRFDKLFGDKELVMAGPCNFSGIWVSEIVSEQ
jgi:hypothetical protein